MESAMSRAASAIETISNAVKWIEIDTSREMYEPRNPFRQSGSFATDDTTMLQIVGRARPINEGRRTVAQVNPALLAAAPE